MSKDVLQWETNDAVKSPYAMKPYHKNPRQITKRQMDDLGAWLAELGDLSGIVHDLNTDEIIGGNQRGRVFNVNECEIELTDGPHQPDAQGTVAHGFIVWRGARYAYRQVRFSERQAEQANIVANKAGGGWDFDTLANEFDAGELIEWGFSPRELGLEDDDPHSIPVGPPEQKISPELFERHDYIVFYIDNEMDWKFLTNRFGIETVESAPVGKRTLSQRGQGRLLPASRLIEELDHG